MPWLVLTHQKKKLKNKSIRQLFHYKPVSQQQLSECGMCIAASERWCMQNIWGLLPCQWVISLSQVPTTVSWWQNVTIWLKQQWWFTLLGVRPKFSCVKQPLDSCQFYSKQKLYCNKSKMCSGFSEEKSIIVVRVHEYLVDQITQWEYCVVQRGHDELAQRGWL